MSKRILIIDDDVDLCDEIAELLADEGYAVENAFDGLAGLKKLREAAYDLILLDIKLPHVNGLEILQRIKGERSREGHQGGQDDAKVILLSANPVVNQFLGEQLDLPEEDARDVLSLADSVLNKPHDVEILLAKIRSFLDPVHP